MRYIPKFQQGKTINGPTIRGKQYPTGTVVTNDPNDPKLKAYQDSLSLYKSGKEYHKMIYNFSNENLLRFLPIKDSYRSLGLNKEDINKNEKELLQQNIVEEKFFKKYKWDKEDIDIQRMFNNMAQKALSTGNIHIGTYPGEGFYPAFKKPTQPIVYNDMVKRMQPKGFPTPTIIPNERIQPDVIYKDNNVPNAAYNQGFDISHFTDSLGRWAAKFNQSTTSGYKGRLSTPNPKGNYTTKLDYLKFQRGGGIELTGPTIRGQQYPAGTIVTNDKDLYQRNQDSLALYKDISYYGNFKNNAFYEQSAKEFKELEKGNANRSFYWREENAFNRLTAFNKKQPRAKVTNITGTDESLFPDRLDYYAIKREFAKPTNMVFGDKITQLPMLGLPTPTITPNERIQPDVIYKDNNVPNAAYNQGFDISHYTDALGRWAAKFNMSTIPGYRGRLSTPNLAGDYTTKTTYPLLEKGGKLVPKFQNPNAAL
ncbi:MAG: hypothetical protein ACOH2V_00085 [Candidatus Saccharimonadaceae bacterium]